MTYLHITQLFSHTTDKSLFTHFCFHWFSWLICPFQLRWKFSSWGESTLYHHWKVPSFWGISVQCYNWTIIKKKSDIRSGAWGLTNFQLAESILHKTHKQETRFSASTSLFHKLSNNESFSTIFKQVNVLHDMRLGSSAVNFTSVVLCMLFCHVIGRCDAQKCSVWYIIIKISDTKLWCTTHLLRIYSPLGVRRKSKTIYPELGTWHGPDWLVETRRFENCSQEILQYLTIITEAQSRSFIKD